MQAGARIESAAFSRDEKTVVIAGTNANNQLWDLNDPMNPLPGDELPSAATSLPELPSPVRKPRGDIHERFRALGYRAASGRARRPRKRRGPECG